MKIKMVVADDHEVIRLGLEKLLEDVVEIVAVASNGEEAIAATLEHKPEVLLMDVMMPDCDGLEALEKLREKSPATRVVMMSAHDNMTYVARSVALGADGYVLKESPREVILESVQRAARGDTPPPESPLVRIKELLATRKDPTVDDVPLTKREYQVLRHLAYGLSNREIGRSLNISIETVKEHVQNILRKLDAADRTEAAVWAVKRSLA